MKERKILNLYWNVDELTYEFFKFRYPWVGSGVEAFAEYMGVLGKRLKP